MSDDRLPPENADDESHSNPRGGASITQLAMMAMAIVVSGYLLLNLIGDAASWHLAAAQEHNLERNRDDTNGQLKLALESIDAAVAADPKNLMYLQRRSLWRRDAGDFEGALRDIELIEAQIPTGDEGFQSRIGVLQLRGLIYQRQGKHAEAVVEQTRMIDRLAKRYEGVTSMEDYSTAMSLALNNRAYFRAVGNLELEEALKDIDESLKLAGYEDGKPSPYSTQDEAVKRDTRGYLRYLLGDYQGALNDMERAIQVAENSYSILRMKVMNESRTVVDRRPIDLHMREYEENLAVLYHHRGLIFDKIGRRFDAQVDFDRAKRMGYNPARGVF